MIRRADAGAAASMNRTSVTRDLVIQRSLQLMETLPATSNDVAVQVSIDIDSPIPADADARARRKANVPPMVTSGGAADNAKRAIVLTCQRLAIGERISVRCFARPRRLFSIRRAASV